MIGQIEVFISSTCYDLIDLRRELGHFLKGLGCIVYLSDCDDSDFVVHPNVSSIESCLANVRAADAIVCIIDQRYGPLLKCGEHGDVSATHAEIKHAREHDKKVLAFIRDRTINEYAFVKDNEPNAKTRWVKDDNRKLFHFIDELKALAPAESEGHSN